MIHSSAADTGRASLDRAAPQHPRQREPGARDQGVDRRPRVRHSAIAQLQPQ